MLQWQQLALFPRHFGTLFCDVQHYSATAAVEVHVELACYKMMRFWLRAQ